MNRLLFSKTGDAVFLSHLDLMRVFQRAFRRAGMLLKHSQGFTPHAYVSLLLPLPVGVASQCEILDFALDDCDPTPLQTVPEKLNACLPAGIHIREFYQSDRKPKEMVYLRCLLTLEYDREIPDGAKDALEALFARDSLTVEKITKSGAALEQDIKQMLPWYAIGEGEGTLQILCVVCAQNPSLNPMQLVKAIERYLPQYAPDFASCERLEFLDQAQKPFR